MTTSAIDIGRLGPNPDNLPVWCVGGPLDDQLAPKEHWQSDFFVHEGVRYEQHSFVALGEDHDPAIPLFTTKNEAGEPINEEYINKLRTPVPRDDDEGCTCPRCDHKFSPDEAQDQALPPGSSPYLCLLTCPKCKTTFACGRMEAPTDRNLPPDEDDDEGDGVDETLVVRPTP